MAIHRKVAQGNTTRLVGRQALHAMLLLQRMGLGDHHQQKALEDTHLQWRVHLLVQQDIREESRQVQDKQILADIKEDHHQGRPRHQEDISKGHLQGLPQ